MGEKNDGWFDNLVDLFETGVSKFAKNNLFGTKNAQGNYDWVSYEYVGNRVENLRSGLASLGLKKGDAIGGIFNNRVEYAVVCFATYGVNGIWIPMYLKERPQVWKYIINDSGLKCLIVNDNEIYDTIMGFKDELPNLEHIYIIETDKDNSLDALEKKGSQKIVPSIKPASKDIACMIYTSGTTGEPKGVLLSHGNLTSNAQAGYNGFYNELTEDSISFNILPWAHSYGLTAELNNWLQFGGSIGFMESTDTLILDLPKVAPTHLISVPRVFNKIYDGLHKKMEVAGGLKLKLFNKTKELAKKKRETGKAGLLYKILEKVIIEKIRAAFGGRLRMAFTGSAVMNVDIAKFFTDIGINCYDAYGLSETSPAATMNSPILGWKLGSVGRPVEKVSIKIDKSRVGEDSKDGEIIIYGPNVMQGYHNKPKQTAEVMTPDGGLRTGDRGWLDEEGYLFITGRFKEEYKLQNGKYVHPASIEEDLKLLPYITNAFVYGEGKQYNVALIVPDLETIQEYAEKIQLQSVKNFDEFIKSEDVREVLAKEIQAHLSKTYGGYEIPRKFYYITDDFSVENGMLTQTLKLKRRNVLEKYKDYIEYLYSKEGV